MLQVEFSSEEITFDYKEKTHLHSKVTIKNSNTSNIYYKFKLTRPKYYLVKPDRGFIQPNQTAVIEITLHQEGVNEGESDKIKCFYRSVGFGKTEPAPDWEKNQMQTFSIRLPIIINGLPEQFKRHNEGVKHSEIKSLANSKFQGFKSGHATLQNSIREKQSKLGTLRNQIQTLKKGGDGKSKGQSEILKYVIVGGAGLLIGLLTSLWF